MKVSGNGDTSAYTVGVGVILILRFALWPNSQIIGTDVTGSVRLGNPSNAIAITGSYNDTIGGASPNSPSQSFRCRCCRK
jgi:hypothetical protein